MQSRLTRRAALAAGFTALAGCVGQMGSSGEDGGSTTTTSRAPSTTTVQDSVLPLAERQLPVADSFERLRDRTGTGAARDSIPAIDEPTFVPRSEATVEEDDVVFGIVTGETVKAYPQKILVWHEIVNDTIGGTPVSVTYCPLTGTVLGFERGETTFGVSGKLVNNNLVMYDRETDSWWSQMLGTSYRGHYEGHSLRQFPLVWTRWRRWRKAFPETEVLSRDTGYIRNYNSDPYGGYSPKRGYYSDSPTLFEPLRSDGRYHAKKVFIATRAPPGVTAVEKSMVGFHKVIQAGDYLAVHDQALDATRLYHNPDSLEFEWTEGTVIGPSDSYGPADLPLEPVMAFDAMWFAWAGFYPETAVYP